MNKKLRLIGTEFWFELPPSQTEGNQKRLLYRVKSHKKAARFFGDEEGEIAEEIKILKWEVRQMKSMTLVQCPLCKQNQWEYQFDEWKEG